MTDPTRLTTVAERLLYMARRIDAGIADDEPRQDNWSGWLRDAADALSTAERHAGQLVELNMALEAKATAMEEQRDAAREMYAAALEREVESLEYITALRLERDRLLNRYQMTK